MVEPIILVLGLIVAVLSLITVFARSAISSAFSLVMAMVALGGIYAVIGAHFVAALQVIVYAGAIMVLFVFSIMLLNMNEDQTEISWKSPLPWAAGGLVSVLFLLLAAAFFSWSEEKSLPVPESFTLENIRALGGNVAAISGTLFSKAFIQFEFLSLLLLVAIAGALVLAKRKVD